MNYQNYNGVPNQCVASKTLNQNQKLQTVYNSKCNDHLTPQVQDTCNSVKNILSDKSWSNVRGYGFIQQASCDNQVTEYQWNRLPNLNVHKNNTCA
jgi:hypothetical protein